MTEQNINEVLNNIRAGKDLRQNLSSLREILREESKAGIRERTSKLQVYRNQICREWNERDWNSFFREEDAKIRKNAANLAGDLLLLEPDEGWSRRIGEILWRAYLDEKTLFVRSIYLKALALTDCSLYMEEMQKRLNQLGQEEHSTEKIIHIRAERQALEAILGRENGGGDFLHWKGITSEQEILLECQPYICGPLKKKLDGILKNAKASRIVPRGLRVRVSESNYEHVLACRTYRDFLFYVPLRRGTVADQKGAAKAICSSKLLPILDEIYSRDERQPEEQRQLKEAGGKASYRFRISWMKQVRKTKTETKRDKARADGNWIRRLAAQIEEESAHRLVNAPGNYQLEILLAAKKDGSYRVYLRASLYQDRRFAYRLYTEPTSMAPYKAAQMTELLAPYLRSDHQVMDPLAGVGSLLIERAYTLGILPSQRQEADCYALDTYGKAVAEGRENVAAAGLRVQYINRSFFDFRHEYPFDEILTEAPQMTAGQKEEREYFYRAFFDQAIRTLTKEGLIMLLSDQGNLVRKQIRLHDQLRLEREIAMGERRSIYVISRR